MGPGAGELVSGLRTLPHTPTPTLGGFSDTMFFGNVIYRSIEIRLFASIPVVGENVRALFQNGCQKFSPKVT